MPASRSQKLINALIGDVMAHEKRPIRIREIAERLNMQPATLSKWRNGSTQLEQIEWLLQLIDGLPKDRWIREIEDIVKPPSSTRGRKK